MSLRSDGRSVAPGDLEQESRNVEDEIEDYDYWPILSVGISFRL